MSTVPSADNRTFWGVNTVFIISGVTYAALGDFNVSWGYRIHEEIVTGRNLPYLGTGGFHGELTGTLLGASDARLEGLVGITGGQTPTFGMTWREGDIQATASTRTWTISGKFTEYAKTSERDNVVRYRIRLIMSNEPTVA